MGLGVSEPVIKNNKIIGIITRMDIIKSGVRMGRESQARDPKVSFGGKNNENPTSCGHNQHIHSRSR